MPLNLVPEDVYYREEKGELFMGDPVLKDREKAELLENATVFGVVILIMVMIYIVTLVVSVLLGVKDLGTFGVFGIAILLMIPGVVLLLFFIHRSRLKNDKEPYIFFTKVFSDRIAFAQFCGLWNRLNMVMVSDIRKVHFDGADFLVQRGIKLPGSHRPFMQLSPASTKFPGALYPNNTPVEYLLRLEFERPLEIMNWDTGSYGLIKGDMITRDRVHRVENIIIPVRPSDQDRFEGLVMSRKYQGS
ncbi:MAG: hypothetical protein ACMUHB_04820 [Thermoplasmatota archaeon]